MRIYDLNKAWAIYIIEELERIFNERYPGHEIYFPKFTDSDALVDHPLGCPRIDECGVCDNCMSIRS